MSYKTHKRPPGKSAGVIRRKENESCSKGGSPSEDLVLKRGLLGGFPFEDFGRKRDPGVSAWRDPFGFGLLAALVVLNGVFQRLEERGALDAGQKDESVFLDEVHEVVQHKCRSFRRQS